MATRRSTKKAAPKKGSTTTKKAATKRRYTLPDSDIRKAVLESMSRDLSRLADVDPVAEERAYRDRMVIPSNIFELDNVLMAPVGGFLRGKVYEIFGESSSWKTTLAIKVAGIALSMYPNVPVGVVDAESAWNPDSQGSWMRTNGMDPNLMLRLPIFETDQVLRTIVEWCNAGVKLIIWDTYAATITISKAENRFGQQRLPGSGPRALSEAMPQIRRAVEENEVLLLMLNQARKSFGFYSPHPFDSPGGYPKDHNVDGRIAMSATKYISDKGVDIGREVRIEIRKSRLFPDGKETGKNGVCPNIRFYFDGTVGDSAEVIADMAVELKIVKLRGGWYEWGGISAQGIKKFVEALHTEDRVDELWEEVHDSPGELLADLAEADERDVEDLEDY